MRNIEVGVRLDWCPPIPENFFDHYKLGGYEEYQVARIENKYLSRIENIKRAWARIHCHFPETLNANIPLDILEFSTAHGAMLEIWRHFGHRVQGTDCQDLPDGYRRKLGIPKWLEHVLEDRHSNKRNKKNPAGSISRLSSPRVLMLIYSMLGVCLISTKANHLMLFVVIRRSRPMRTRNIGVKYLLNSVELPAQRLFWDLIRRCGNSGTTQNIWTQCRP